MLLRSTCTNGFQLGPKHHFQTVPATTALATVSTPGVSLGVVPLLLRGYRRSRDGTLLNKLDLLVRFLTNMNAVKRNTG